MSILHKFYTLVCHKSFYQFHFDKHINFILFPAHAKIINRSIYHNYSFSDFIFVFVFFVYMQNIIV